MDSFPELPTAEEWAEKFRAARERSVQAVVAFGQLLTEGKAELGHGQWRSALKLAGVDEREAQKCMRIANHPVLSNPTNFPYLPHALATLSLLSGLQVETVRSLIAEEVLHPRITTREVKEAVNGPTTAKGWSTPEHVNETVKRFLGGAIDHSGGDDATKEWHRDDESLILLPAITHTAQFHNFLSEGVACFPLGKIGVPPRSVVLVYKGLRRDEFVAAVGDMGVVVEAIGSHS